MKHKKILILFTILFLAFSFLGIKTVKSSTQTETSMVSVEFNQQIQIFQKEIQRLGTLISILKLQKEITAESYLVTNLSDNSVILEKNSNQLYSIASIVKLMTAVIAFENIDLNQTITLNEEMLEPFGYSPALFIGLNVSAKNLLKASLIQSTNDAALSLIYFLEKGKFLDLMNQKTKKLNMTNTFFYDPHGLNPSDRSTVSDIAKLLAYIYKNHPEILSITKDNNFWLPGQTGKLLKFMNLNNFYQLPEFVGGKTGDLPEAKQTLASLFNLNGRPIAIILFHSENRKADTLGILNWLKNSSSLK